MPAYRYEALNADGQTEQGLLEADTVRVARTVLRQRGWIPLAVHNAATIPNNLPTKNNRLWQRPLWPKRVFSAVGLAVWTRQLAGLVGAGLPLERALSALADGDVQMAQQNLVAHLRAEVHAGSSFARALGHYPREFDLSYCAVIAAGEQGGQLGTVLTRLATDLEERDALRQKLISAALYPCIVSVFALAIVGFLMTYVVPQVASVFTGRQQALPILTVIMLALSEGLRHWGWLLALLGLGMGLLWWQVQQRPKWRQRTDATWLRLPILGALSQGYNASRFAATLAMLASAGIPILKALHTATDTLHNQALRQDAEHVLDLVREGASLASALQNQSRFPQLLVLFARLGEQTGQLPTMLERAAAQLGAEVQRRALRLATLLEPLLIVLMGLMVMLIVLAVLMPIMQLNQLVQ